MSCYPIRDDEDERLKALRELDIIGKPAAPDLQAIVALASAITEAPTAIVSLLDADTQHHHAKVGIDAVCVSRDDSFCTHTVFQNAPLIVEDATRDARFKNNVLVASPDGVRFYAGFPLRSESGLPLGAVCVIDTKPRVLSDEQLAQLDELGVIASSLLRQNHATKRLAALSRTVAETSESLVRQARDLAMSNALLQDACELGEMGAFEHDLRTGTMRWSEALIRLHELDPADHAPDRSADFSHLRDFYSKKDFSRYVKAVRASMHNGATVDLEMLMRTAKGRRRWVRVRVDFEYEDNVPVRRYGMVQDITRQKRLLTRLDYLANRDPLTGLYNRNHFLRQGNIFLSSGTGGISGIAVIDLDGFKAINDTYGHGAGDACLKAIGRRLKLACNSDFMLVRPGGDEFTIVFSAMADKASLVAFFETLRTAIQQPIDWRGISFQVSASIGLSWRETGEDAAVADLVQEADLAVYKAKASGRNCVECYSADLHRTALARFNAITLARTALENDQFVLAYQPKVFLSDGGLAGFEALLRLRKSDGSLVGPAAFHAALSDHDMSRRIGNFVIDAAIAQAAAWRKAGFAFGSIAINVSSSQFAGRSFVEPLIEKIAAAGLSPADIQVEITEGVLLSTGGPGVADGLKRLTDKGIRVAFDDFGTGYASLVHLRQLEFDIIKLDMSFVQSMLTSPADMAIVQSVLMLANRLGKTVIAEGVETETQRDLLRSYGCHQAQGYFYSAAKHPDAILADWAGQQGAPVATLG